MEYKILDKKQVKQLLARLEKQFNIKLNLDYIFLKNNKGKIFIINKKFSKLDINKLKINKVGLYFAKEEKGGLRLSIEGSLLLKNSKNTLELNEKQMYDYMKGLELAIKEKDGNYILKHKDIFLGSIPDFDIASLADSSAAFAKCAASCSTQLGLGYEQVYSTYPLEINFPFKSNNPVLAPVVPTSIPAKNLSSIFYLT